MFTPNNIIQAAILILGGIAIACISSLNKRTQTIGFVAGALSEPLWLYVAWVADQWGVVVLATWWAAFYAIGLWKRIKK